MFQATRILLAVAALLPMASAFTTYQNLAEAVGKPIFIDAKFPPNRLARVETEGRRVFKLHSVGSDLYEIQSYFDENFALNVHGQDFRVTRDSPRRYKIEHVADDIFSIKTDGQNGKFVAFDHNAGNAGHWQVNRDAVGAWEKLTFGRATVNPPNENDIIQIISEHQDHFKIDGLDELVVRKHGEDVSLAALNRPNLLLPPRRRLVKRTAFAILPIAPIIILNKPKSNYETKCLQFNWTWNFLSDKPESNKCWHGPEEKDKNAWIGSWEKFFFQHEGEGYFSLRGANDKDSKKAMLQKVPHGDWKVMEGTAGAWEKFTINTVGSMQ